MLKGTFYFHFHKFDKNCVTMDETIYVIFKVLLEFALEVWFSIYPDFVFAGSEG